MSHNLNYPILYA